MERNQRTYRENVKPGRGAKVLHHGGLLCPGCPAHGISFSPKTTPERQGARAHFYREGNCSSARGSREWVQTLSYSSSDTLVASMTHSPFISFIPWVVVTRPSKWRDWIFLGLTSFSASSSLSSSSRLGLAPLTRGDQAGCGL